MTEDLLYDLFGSPIVGIVFLILARSLLLSLNPSGEFSKTSRLMLFHFPFLIAIFGYWAVFYFRLHRYWTISPVLTAASLSVLGLVTLGFVAKVFVDIRKPDEAEEQADRQGTTGNRAVWKVIVLIWAG